MATTQALDPEHTRQIGYLADSWFDIVLAPMIVGLVGLRLRFVAFPPAIPTADEVQLHCVMGECYNGVHNKGQGDTTYMSKQAIVLLMVVMLVLVGCRQQAPLTSEDINIQLSFASETLEVGDDTVIVTLTDDEGNPIDNATVNVRGDMSHAGMQPVLREIESATDGIYESDYEWTMAGDWEVGVTVTLPDGVTSAETFAFTVEGEMDDMDMDSEDDDMDDMDMDSEDDDMDDMNMDAEATDEAYSE